MPEWLRKSGSIAATLRAGRGLRHSWSDSRAWRHFATAERRDGHGAARRQTSRPTSGGPSSSATTGVPGTPSTDGLPGPTANTRGAAPDSGRQGSFGGTGRRTCEIHPNRDGYRPLLNQFRQTDRDRGRVSGRHQRQQRVLQRHPARSGGGQLHRLRHDHAIRLDGRTPDQTWLRGAARSPVAAQLPGERLDPFTRTRGTTRAMSTLSRGRRASWASATTRR